MKNIFTIFFLSLSICGFAQSDSLLKAFRSTSIENGNKVILQSDINELLEICIRKNNNIFSLKKGTYRYVDSIGIEVNDNNKIIALTFLYGYDSSLVHEPVYFHEQKKYFIFFQGDGKHYDFKSANFSISVTKWEDKSTIFELVETIINNKTTVYSRLFDKQLYYLQYCKKINLEKINNSIELLRRLELI